MGVEFWTVELGIQASYSWVNRTFLNHLRKRTNRTEATRRKIREGNERNR